MPDSRTPEQLLATYDKLVESLNQAAQILLADSADFDEAIHEVFAVFGAGTDVDRVYLWQIHPHPERNDGELYTTQLYEWSLGAEPQQDLDICVNRPMSAIPHWMESFRHGKCVNGLVKNMGQAERSQLEQQGIISILIAPVRFHGSVWGFIGFDDCHSERSWTVVEENILKVAGAIVGVAVHKHRINDDLRRAKAELESNNARLEEALTQANEDRKRGDTAVNAGAGQTEVLPALDVQAGMRRAGNAEAYLKQLKEAAESLPLELQLLEDALEDDRYEEAEFQVYTIRAALSGLGLEQAAGTAAELLNALRRHGDTEAVDTARRHLAEAVQQTLEGIRKAVREMEAE